ncbi:helix-turn-helix transcriptional regulator [Amorphus sp. MBR-141]
MDDENARAARAKRGSPFLNTAQAAFYVGLSARTLEKMRTAGTGPIYRKHGRYVRYHIDDLDAWSEGRTTSAGDAHSSGQSDAPGKPGGQR